MPAHAKIEIKVWFSISKLLVKFSANSLSDISELVPLETGQPGVSSV